MVFCMIDVSSSTFLMNLALELISLVGELWSRQVFRAVLNFL